MTTQSDIKNELKDLIQNYSCSCNVQQDMFVKHRNRFKHQIFDFFKKMAKECVPHKKEKHHPMFDAQKFEIDGFNACAVETHKNIEEKFR